MSTAKVEAQAQGNAHRQVGSYTTTVGQTRGANDVWGQTDATDSAPNCLQVNKLVNMGQHAIHMSLVKEET